MSDKLPIQSMLAELRAHAELSGDAVLLERVQQLEQTLSGAGHGSPSGDGGLITVGNITGSTAVAIGSDIQICIRQTTNLPDELAARLTTLVETLDRRAEETFDAVGHTLRIFLASPSDVKDERGLALKAIAKLQNDPLYKERITIEAVAWDKPDDSTPLLAGIDPQSAINEGLARPSDCDIFAAIFWSRMGTPLDHSSYQKPDGSQYLSGTEWELEEALKAFRESGRPQVLVYRRMEDVLLNPNTLDFDEKVKQWRLVQDFFANFKNADGSIRLPYNEYLSPSGFSDLFEQHLRKLIARIIEEKHPVAKSKRAVVPDKIVQPLTWPKGKSPFACLRSLGEADAPIFFGRGAETDELVRRLAEPHCRFLAVVGASGSGKSSLVGAGLIPRLREGALPGSEAWRIVRFTPDEWSKGDPFDSLAGALIADPLRLEARHVNPRLREAAVGLRQVLEESLEHCPEWGRIVLVIDQFEELFTRVHDSDLRKAFSAALDEASRSPRLLTVVTMRDDFYHHCVKSSVLSKLINRNNSSFTLSAPGPIELYEMITGPARVAGLQYEAGLARRILDATGDDPGGLALMGYALHQLYKASHIQGQAGLLTQAAYGGFGGVQGAIGACAQATFERLEPSAQAALPLVFRELVEVDESGTATRKRASLESVQHDQACKELVQALVEARLLVTSSGTGESTLIEVAHEAIFRSWPRLKEWIEEAQDDLILLRQVRTAVALWKNQDHHPAYRWPDERLQPVYAMQLRLQPNLEEHEQEFIRSEFDRLMEEINNPAISHLRRSEIGDRLNRLHGGDRRPGVGVIGGIMPLRPREADADGPAQCAADKLCPGEVRLWGDKPEHIGLPDIIWLAVEETRKYKLVTDYGEERTYDIPPFYIAKYPVTYVQFQAFLDALDGFQHARWWQGLAAGNDHKNKPERQRFKFDNHARENISWDDAIAFCRWLNARLGWPDMPLNLTPQTLRDYQGLRLPAEWEWQWAATGGHEEYEYPWGPKWDDAKANTNESGLGRTTAVGMYPAGAAPCAVLDMSGNVWEWCLNEYKNPENTGLGGYEHRVGRGGSWFFDSIFARVAARLEDQLMYRSAFGFRLVASPPSP